MAAPPGAAARNQPRQLAGGAQSGLRRMQGILSLVLDVTDRARARQQAEENQLQVHEQNQLLAQRLPSADFVRKPLARARMPKLLARHFA